MIERLTQLVEEAKFKFKKKQRGVAEMLGISEQSLSDMLKGRRKDDTVELYCNKLESLLDIADNTPTEEDTGIPFYEIENFECGTPAGFSGALEATSPNGYFNFPWVKNDGSTFCVKAHGNSMLNRDDPNHSISHGSYIALKRNEVNAIQWGEVYALATANGYIIKKLMPSEREGYVKCVSFNSEEFPPFDLNVNEIYDYAIVVGVATINLW